MVTPEVERRDLTERSSTTSLEEIAERCAGVSDRLPGSHRLLPSGCNRLSGTPERLRSENSAEEPVPDRSLISRALEHLRSIEGALARPGEILEWVPEPRVHTTSSGVRLVRLRQTYRGVPVFEAMRTVRFDASGAVVEVTGDHVPLRGDLDLVPDLTASEAVLVAAQHLARTIAQSGEAGVELRFTDNPPRHVATFHLPGAPALYEKRPFAGPIPVHAMLFFMAPETWLGWFLSLRLPGRAGVYDLIVGAEGPDAGEILWCRRVTAHGAPARGAVFLHDAGEARRAMVDFPPALDAYPALRPRRSLPPEFPHPWVTDRRTAGPNALSRRGNRAFEGRPEQGVVVFEPDRPDGEDQRVLNAFYIVNYIHDFFYLLGFDEAEGNFQQVNLPGVGRGNDRVEIGVFEIVLGEASMEPTADGNPPRMSLGKTTAGRHTALDADIVIHELVHGITDRIVGGGDVIHPMGRTLQSRALDEGTCDYFALTIESYRRLGLDPPGPEHLVHAAWAGGQGRRSYEDLQLRFGDLRGVTEPHRAGQVWGGALLAMNRHIGRAVDDARRGHEIGWQLVVDALKLLEVTPLSISFLAGRDRIIEALEMMRSAPPVRSDGAPLLPAGSPAEVDEAIRSAFREMGMGRAASGTGPDFRDLVEDRAT